jgi:ABC-2 type transport system ATP-binding protein
MYKTLNAAEQAAPAVEARSLLKIYEKNRVVDGIDLTLPVGKVYGILGPNGAGKTTTIKMLTTLLKPDGGIAKIFGHDVQKEANTVRRLIGVTGQYASLDEKLSAYENLFIFSRLLGFSPRGARKKAGYLLAEFDLEDVAARLVEKFSGGMRRRLDLAASLISEPPLLFLDEPTTGLDPRNRAMIWDLIRGLVSKGTTVLLTTQYLDEADQLAEGTSNELKASIGANTLHLRLDGGNNTEKATAIINQILGVKCAVTDDLNISAPMKTPGLVTDLLIAFRNVGIGLSEISVQKPTLDEVFLTITGHSAKEKSGGAI